MSTEEEKEHWRKLVQELNQIMTIAQIAEAIDVEERQVWRWKAGERRPMGMDAVRVHTLHAKMCPSRQCLVGHSQE